MKYHVRIAPLLACLFAPALACNGDDDDDDDGENAESSPDQAGAACELPADCYPEIDHADLLGEALCLDRVRGGYCTHECSDDTECCAVDGECVSDFTQVCSPFESGDVKMCFLSCEDADVDASGAPDDQSFCQTEANSAFICRSSGGGSENRKVCVPGDCGVGAQCDEDAQCDPDLVCIGDFDGGYCGRRDCSANADCPQDSVCVGIGDESYCLNSCTTDGDCSFCRDADVAALCTSDVMFAEVGTTGSVCVPPSE